jgi:hypothetical protein
MLHRIVVLATAYLLAMTASASAQLVIRIEPKGWGDADAEDIRRVLESAGREVIKQLPADRPIRIKVVPTAEVPQVDFRRAADGEMTVRLAVKNRHWSQFAYQFAHEVGHIISHYERRHDNKVGEENLWFDEMVCEAASLFVLAKMGETWKTDPPYSNWKSYAGSLADYHATRLKGIDAPAAERMPAWFAENRAALRANPVLRDRNATVAAHFVKLLEADPTRWEAIRYLNLGRPDAANSFENYLENWYYSVPRAHKPFVKEVVDLLGVKSELIAKHASAK